MNANQAILALQPGTLRYKTGSAANLSIASMHPQPWLGTILQREPSQCSMIETLIIQPTAQTSLLATAAASFMRKLGAGPMQIPLHDSTFTVHWNGCSWQRGAERDTGKFNAERLAMVTAIRLTTFGLPAITSAIKRWLSIGTALFGADFAPLCGSARSALKTFVIKPSGSPAGRRLQDVSNRFGAP
jgi:hypothetical protein